MLTLTSSYLPGSCSGAEVAALLRLAKTTALLCRAAARAAVFPESVWDSTTTRWDWLLAMSPDVARCRQMSPDVARCRQMSPDVARAGVSELSEKLIFSGRRTEWFQMPKLYDPLHPKWGYSRSTVSPHFRAVQIIGLRCWDDDICQILK